MPEYTDKRARTRAQFLAAGQELLPGAVRRGIEQALGPGPVARRAGLSRQSWYRYWAADDSEYVDELIRTSAGALALLLRPGTERLRSLAASADAPVRAVVTAHCALVGRRRVLLLRTLVAVLAVEDQFLEEAHGTRPTAATAVLHGLDDRMRVALEPAYQVALRREGRVPAPPLTLAGVVEQVACLVDGWALRRAGRAESAPPAATPEPADHCVHAAVGLVHALTRARDG